MTPKEKAKELVNRIYQPLGFLSCNASSGKMWDYSKERAIELVDEMLDQLEWCHIYTGMGKIGLLADYIPYDFWTQVKKELQTV